ncbi:hypothetical protein IT411_02930, partial [Candidatus Peregrinibacteria bacterium]|nr:hypothetical protein [Candidatus Peregrinibacteria bacterium]
LEMSEQKEKSVVAVPAKSSFWKTFLGLLVVVVLIINSLQLWQMSSVVNRVDKYNQGVIDEVGSVVGDVKTFGEDLNEIREFLLLPTKDYSFEKDPEQKGNTANDTEENSSNTLGAYAFLNSFVAEQKMNELRAKAAPIFETLIQSEDWNKTLSAAGLLIAEKADLQLKLKDNQLKKPDGLPNELYGEPLYNLIFVAEKNVFRVQSALEEKDFPGYDQIEWEKPLLAYLSDNVGKVREKKVADKQKALEETKKAETDLQTQLESRKQELTKLVTEKAFAETLTSIGLKVADAPREEQNKFIYDVFGADGKVKFSLALEVSSGMIKVIKDNQENDITTYLNQDNGSKKKP